MLAVDGVLQVLNGSVPPPPAYKVTAMSVANKGEPFLSGIPNSREAVQSFLDSIMSPTAPTAAGQTPGAAATAEAAADVAAAAAAFGGKVSWRVVDYMGPREVRMKRDCQTAVCPRRQHPPVCW
jgi:hypothetical protein